ncbi:MAG: hypothetical protein HY718_08120 [Planctomycetes bacterium]|nr:hypothetical protein [Planctomycetota bacterium]
MILRTQAAALITDVTGLTFGGFQSLLAARAEAAANWIVRSIDACGGEGSSAFYSRIYHPLRGWAPPYPETTGYIIPTLIDYSRFARRRELVDLAVMQARWVMTLQYLDGALPGGFLVRGVKAGPSIFNTGQMILGLVAASDTTSDQAFLQGAASSARWLADELNDPAGIWTTHAYVAGYAPAYYTRVCWPMLEVWQRTREERIRQKALRVLGTISGWQLDDGTFRNWSFRPNRPAFTHTIAYTIRGLLESGRILGDEGRRFVQQAAKAALTLRRQLEQNGRLAGAYGPGLAGHYWYTCLTGNCQLAIIWLKLARLTGDIEYLRAALQAVWFVIRRQRMGFCRGRNVRGAIAGSSPLWGRYLFVRYPNWAAKFFIDAILETHHLLQDAAAPTDDAYVPGDAPILTS